LKKQEKLSEELSKLGYDSLALQWTRAALASIEALLKKEADESTLSSLYERRLRLSERLAELKLQLMPDSRAGGDYKRR